VTDTVNASALTPPPRKVQGSSGKGVGPRTARDCRGP
jgi:hypothetical protein